MASFTGAPLGYVGSLAFPGKPGSEIRGIYETSTPTTQCNNTIGKFVNGVECYICGMAIIQQDLRLGVNGLNPECEHILPIAQAVLFLGLYGDKFKEGRLFYNPTQFKLEYAWAHRTCNQIKSDESYIKYNQSARQFVVDTVALRSFLTKIWNNTRADSMSFNYKLKSTYSKKDTFLKDRLEPLESKFQAICDYLNSFNSPELILLIGAAKALEGPMSEEGSRFVGSVNSAAANDARIAELKTSLESQYDTQLNNVVTELKTKALIKESNTKYEDFVNEVMRYKPFYVSLYIKLGDDTLRANWKKYIYDKFLILYYQTYIDEPLAINTLLHLSQNVPNSSILNTITSRRVDLLAKHIAAETSSPWYQAIQSKEDSLTNSNSINFEETARTAMSMGILPKMATKSKKKATPVTAKKSVKAKPTIEEMAEKRRQKTIELTKKRRNTQMAIKRGIYGPKNGGYRKTRKNRRH